MTSKEDNHDDEIWNSLFGGNNEETKADKSQTKKGYSTLVTKKDKNKKRTASKSTKPSSSSRSKPSSHHRSSSQSSHSRSHSNTPQKTAIINTDGPSTAERLSQFLCTPRNRVKLPPPPLQCKFLKYPHKKDRFTKYAATNLELNYKWEIHHDSLFPIPLDLMDPDYYNPLKHQSSDSDDGTYSILTPEHKQKRFSKLIQINFTKIFFCFFQ